MYIHIHKYRHETGIEKEIRSANGSSSLFILSDWLVLVAWKCIAYLIIISAGNRKIAGAHHLFCPCAHTLLNESIRWLDGCAASQFVWLPNIFMCLLLENNIIYKRRVHRSLDEWIDPASSQWKLIRKRDVRDGLNMLVGENLFEEATWFGVLSSQVRSWAHLVDICFLMILSPRPFSVLWEQ